MLTKRIIPCLDIKDGRTVKGTNFLQLKDAGDPVELAKRYCEAGADELVFLDITATTEKRRTLAELVRKVAVNINIPFTVGGGINSVEDVGILLDNGADKISVNTSAVNNPGLLDDLSRNFGSQCVVIAIDCKLISGEWKVVTHGGRTATVLPVDKWAKECTERGAGEILLTSMEHDGTRQGFATELTKNISEGVNVPVIASGGAGDKTHFAEIFNYGKADAALAAGIFHFREIEIADLKTYLAKENIPVRLC
ncbi:MAG TPA: imidazole glycerol phosphate synthase subunit HisF [Chitinophagaceae bacterium]|nr:imidazole glycerol phosphate synthase subunit HisF [Chitinophagaceae bacterium]